MTDNITLAMPFKAEYVSIARLTASGVASRVGFDIDAIEDIKVAIAEVCNKFVQIGSNTTDNYKINFKVSEGSLRVEFDCDDKALKCAFDNKEDELGISIISALVDSVEFCPADTYLFSMSKSLRGE